MEPLGRSCISAFSLPEDPTFAELPAKPPLSILGWLGKQAARLLSKPRDSDEEPKVEPELERISTNTLGEAEIATTADFVVCRVAEASIVMAMTGKELVLVNSRLKEVLHAGVQ